MSINNYTNFNTSKQTSFRQSYAGVNSNNSNNYNNMNNYSSLTNSSTKPGNTSGAKRAVSRKVKAIHINEANESVENTRIDQILDDEKLDLQKERQRSIDTRGNKGFNNQEHDIEMEDENIAPAKATNHDNFTYNKSSEDMDIDGLVKEMPNEEIKCNLNYENPNISHMKPVTDQQKLDYFHNVVMKQSKTNLIEDDEETIDDTLECSEYVTEIYAHLKNTELEFIAKPGYMKTQSDINEKMRAILIDWLVEVHLKF